MPSPVFADTFYWISLANPGDSAHVAALGFDALPLRPTIVTTDEVLTEFLTFFGGKGQFLRRKAVAISLAIFSDPGVRVLPQTRETFRAGFDLYSNRLDKGYSLTDCISMQTIRRESITLVLTDDHHFEQEGFSTYFLAV